MAKELLISSTTERLTQSFNKLEFDEKNHIYRVDGEIFPSTTKMLKAFHKPFDQDAVAGFVAGKGKFKGMSKWQVLNLWQEQRDFGTRTHLFGERYVYECIKPSNDSELGIVQWWMDLPKKYVPVKLELQVYSEVYKYAGTADIILMNTETGNLVIADYKTNASDIHKSYGKMKDPFKGIMKDTAFNKYQLQMSHYEIPLNEKGFTVEARILVWLVPNPNKNRLYKQYVTKDFRKELLNYYANYNPTHQDTEDTAEELFG